MKLINPKQDDPLGICYVSPTGDDATAKPESREFPYARFDTALKEAASLCAGATVFAEVGTYPVDYMIDIPNYTNLRGAAGTVISSTVDLNNTGPTIVLGVATILQGLTVTTPLDRQFNAALGSYGNKGCEKARVIGCTLSGSTDGVYLRSGDVYKEITFENCLIKSPWDGVAMFDSNCYLKFVHTQFEVHGPPGFTTDAPSHGLMIRGRVTMEHCNVTVSGPNPGNVGVLNSVYGAGAIISLCATPVLCSGPQALAYQIDPSSVFTNSSCCHNE